MNNVTHVGKYVRILSPSLTRIAEGIADRRERELFIAQQWAGDRYDCAVDGAYGNGPEYHAAMREYDRASRALMAYRRNAAQGMVF
jgi:hypothetical protein